MGLVVGSGGVGDSADFQERAVELGTDAGRRRSFHVFTDAASPLAQIAAELFLAAAAIDRHKGAGTGAGETVLSQVEQLRVECQRLLQGRGQPRILRNVQLFKRNKAAGGFNPGVAKDFSCRQGEVADLKAAARIGATAPAEHDRLRGMFEQQPGQLHRHVGLPMPPCASST